jgi:hypothetical protein
MDMTPEEYAAQWGCDPCYDRSPRNFGDGNLFYNFAVERDNPHFLKKFIPAIERTILLVQQEEDLYDATDENDLHELLEYVESILESRVTNPV